MRIDCCDRVRDQLCRACLGFLIGVFLRFFSGPIGIACVLFSTKNIDGFAKLILLIADR